MKLRVTLTAILILSLTASLALAENVQSIVEKASHAAYYQGNNGKARVKMKIVDKQNRERQREFTILRQDVGASTQDTDQRFYVYFHQPTDVSKSAFLVWKHIQKEDNRWLYLPALDLVKRISSSDERTSFMGSHFFYEDVSGRTPTEDNHTLLEETDNYFVIKSEPKDQTNVEFAYYKNWIHKGTFIPVKTAFYDKTNQEYRVYEANQVEQIQGIHTVTESKMTDHRIGGYTTLIYSKVAYDIELPDDLFTERYLRNPPRRYLR